MGFGQSQETIAHQRSPLDIVLVPPFAAIAGILQIFNPLNFSGPAFKQPNVTLRPWDHSDNVKVKFDNFGIVENGSGTYLTHIDYVSQPDFPQAPSEIGAVSPAVINLAPPVNYIEVNCA